MAESSPRRGLPAKGNPGVSAAADRRFRRSSVKPGKSRPWLVRARRIAVLAIAAIAGAGLLVWMAVSFTYASMFRIDRVVVQGNQRLATADVRALVEGIDEHSIFHVDLEEYRTRLLDSPWVADAALWRVFPSTVEVHVTERSPLAVARLNQHVYLVDATGTIIDAAGPQYREYDLPIVDGLLVDEPAGVRADPRKIQLLERLFADLTARDGLFKRVSQVDVTDARNAVVVLEGEQARLMLGDRDFVARLQRYFEAAPGIREHVRAIDYYDLRFDRMFVGGSAIGELADAKSGRQGQ